jgi:hypothetical protein
MARHIRIALVVWLAMIGADFVLNAALFADLYRQNGGFLLRPQEAFRRIPFGYAAFLVLAIVMVELAHRLDVRTARDGARLGAIAGATLAAAWSLGLFSVATLTLGAALAFAFIWLVLLTIAGAVAAAGLGRTSIRGLAVRVLGSDLVGAIVVIALQSFGVVPSIAP